MSTKRTKHDALYNDKRKVKRVSFNLENEKELFDYAESLQDFSGSVKTSLRDAMLNLNQPPDTACKQPPHQSVESQH